jgi:hypothetical protein
MLNRILLLLVTAFWITMNVLLWRSEFRGDGELGAPVPIEAVWEKMLKAPDDSSLEIFHQQKKVGSCRWSANIGEELATGKQAVEELPEGMVKRLAGYTVDITDGYADLGEGMRRMRFSWSGRFTTNHAWQEFTLQLSQRPFSLELRAAADEDAIHLKTSDKDSSWERKLTFAELRDPEQLLREFAGPMPVGLLVGALTSSLGVQEFKGVSLGLQWEARHDWLRIGHAKLRVYRLHARLFDRHQLVVIVSRTGEVLRVQLPGEITLANTSLGGF